MLVERDEPLQQLIQSTRGARRGPGKIVLVAGEPGIGKTALLEEFTLQTGTICNAAWGRCDALFTPRPLGPLHDMARSLGSRVAQPLAGGAQPGDLFASVLAAVEGPALPTALVFEDVHWADHATLDLLKFLGRRISMLRCIMVLSFRDDEVDADHPLNLVIGDFPQAYVQRIALKPLSPDGIDRLSDDQGVEAADLHSITGGNPFFVTELLASRKEHVSSVPASVRDAVGARLNRLGIAERRFLETISVVPGPVAFDMLEPLFGGEGETLGMACVGRQLLRQDTDGSLRFRHELARLATLSRIPTNEQKESHEAVLSALLAGNRPASVDRLVHHAAGARDAKAVLRFAPDAARQASAIGAHREAASHLATALKFIDEAEPELAARLYEDWAYEAGLALRIDDEVLDARRHAISLWRALDRPDKVGENLRWLSRLHWYRGEAVDAQHFADEAVRVLETAAPSAERAMAYSLRAQLHMLNDRMSEAVEWGERALSLAKKFGNVEARIHALNNIGTARVFRNQPCGVRQMQESLDLAVEHGLHEHAARVYTNLAEYAVEFRNYPLAEKVVADGIAFDTQHDLDAWTHYLVGRLAQLRMEQGRLKDAETIAAGVLKLERLTLLMRLPALTVLGKARLRLGESDAQARLLEALDDAMATGELQYIVPIRIALIEAAWLNDSEAAASEHFDYLARLGVSSMHNWHVGELAVWSKRFEHELSQPYYHSLPPPCAAEIRGEHRLAAREWLTLGAPYSAALSLISSDRDLSARNLVRAAKILQSVRARAAESKARRLARGLGVTREMPPLRRGPYDAARNHPLGLTAREQDVLRLLARGSTNKDIAKSLSRSRRTVEHHVSSVLTKLNAANRMEAMLRVRNEPWLLPDASGPESEG